MSQRNSTLQKEQAYRETFLARLNRELGTPSSEWPTVRWWTERSLNQIAKRVREELSTEGLEGSLTNKALLDWLRRLGLADCLRTTEGCFYLIEIGAGANSRVDPLELLMAAKPRGVACYFSAVSFYSLTTQHVGHHHIAELSRPRLDVGKEDVRGDDKPHGESDQDRRGPRSLGTLLFRHQDIPFYFTRRSARLVPGVQSREYGPRTRIRITTLEQTLLDTLYKPFHCGGPEVVFEAWQEGMNTRQVDEGRMVEYLKAMDYPATARRLAVMLGMVGYTPGDELRRLLEAYKGAIDRQSPFAKISLLPGLNYRALNEDWLVRTP
jgi:hypothetical protein